ncbi:hypothetical protein ACRYCC_00345 [Actinomadura scrupuli]|uniref:hypothetical protein n=1 Tax=Actinomadura scrupuli TaxID=559629 RepID=UPI003D9760E8
MWQSVMFGFLAGVFGANAVPHFVKGITKEPFPTPFGPSPVVNVIGGWAMFLLAGSLLYWAHADRDPGAVAASGALGVLLMALFHASIGAFGRRA